MERLGNFWTLQVLMGKELKSSNFLFVALCQILHLNFRSCTRNLTYSLITASDYWLNYTLKHAQYHDLQCAFSSRAIQPKANYKTQAKETRILSSIFAITLPVGNPARINSFAYTK